MANFIGSDYELNNKGMFENKFNNDKKVVIYIFSPRNFTDQCIRPMTYEINRGVLGQVQECMSDAVHQCNENLVLKLADDINVQGAIKSQWSPDRVVKASEFSHETGWTFLMYIDNLPIYNSSGIQMQCANSRTIYFGRFSDEPMNMHGTINPDAVMIILHKTGVTAQRYGDKDLIGLQNDTDIIHGNTLQFLSDRDSYLMRPEELSNVTDLTNNTSVTMITEMNKLGNQGEAIITNSSLKTPSQNMGHILRGIAKTKIDARSPNNGMMHSDLLQESYFDSLTNNLRDVSFGSSILDLDSVISLGDFISRFDPKIIDFNVGNGFNQRDQSIACASNAASSMLAQVIPAIMTQYMIANVGFVYNSFYDKQQLNVGGRALEVTQGTLGYLIPNLDEDTKARNFQYFIRDLTNGIFKVLEFQRGDFEVSASVCFAGLTHINFHYLCDNERYRENYEVPTILGGMISPLIGSGDAIGYNSRNLSTLLGIGIGDDTRPLLGMDDGPSEMQKLFGAIDEGRKNKNFGSIGDGNSFINDNSNIFKSNNDDDLIL